MNHKLYQTPSYLRQGNYLNIRNTGFETLYTERSLSSSYDWVTGGEQNRASPPLRRDLLWTEEVGVCLESDICEERLLELKIPLTKLPRRRAVRDCMDGRVIGCQVCVSLGGGCNKDKRCLRHTYACIGKGRIGIMGGGIFSTKHKKGKKK